MEQYGGQLASYLKPLYSPFAFSVVVMLLVIGFPDAVVKIIVGGIIVFYSYFVFGFLQGNVLLGIYFIGILYMHSGYKTSASKNEEPTTEQKKIKELETQISEKDKKISEKDTEISEKDTQIKEKDAEISEKDKQIATLNTQISGLNTEIARLKEQNNQQPPPTANSSGSGSSNTTIS